MKTPSHDDLKERARELVHRMHDVERWAYAIDAALPLATLTGALAEVGYCLAEEDAPAKVVRYDVEGSPGDTLVTLERPDLGVVLLQAFGPTTPDRLGPVLERTGFVPQSRLLGEAYAVGSPRASQALTALAHMVVLWDDDWADLFLLHLASPDPVARHEAALATVIAALSARQAEPARTLLAEALARESFPQLRDTLAQAVAAVEGIEGRG
jgi:hypothetical protein